MTKRIALALVAAALVVGPAAPARANSFALPHVGIDVQVRPDGSFRVTEQRTFEFSGSFRRAFITIPRGAYSIDAVSVAEHGVPFRRVAAIGGEVPGTFVFGASQREFEIRWFYSASDERRTFTVDYLVRGGVVRYADIGELAWQFIGDRWEVGVRRADVVIRLPSGTSTQQLRAWGHGPLHGEVELIPPDAVRMSIDGLPARTFLAARVVFGQELLSDAPKRAGTRLQAVLAEEARLAEEANAERDRLRALEAKRRRINRGLEIAAPLVALAAFGLFGWMFLRYGKEHEVADPGRYLREPPADYPPSILGYLWRFGTVEAVDMVATLMDLARRGHVSIAEERTDKGLLFKRPDYRYRIRLGAGRDGLAPYERTLVALLREASEDGSIRDDELKAWARANPSTMEEYFDTFKQEVAEHGERLALVQKGRTVIMALSGAAGLFAMVVGVFAQFRVGGPLSVPVIAGLFFFAVGVVVFMKARVFGFIAMLVGLLMVGFITSVGELEVSVPALLAIGIAGLQLAFSPSLRQRTRKGAADFARWSAFKRFLEDFSRMSEKRPVELTLWERYLVYAVPLGCAEAVTKAIELNAPPEVRDRGFAWYSFSDGAGHSFAASLGSFTDSFTSNATAAFSSSPSSAGGSGGGFSGGGGSFGGGGGGGAS